MILWKKSEVQIKTKFNGVIRPLARSNLWKKKTNKQTNKAVNLFIFNTQTEKNTRMEVLFSCRWRILYKQSDNIKKFYLHRDLVQEGRADDQQAAVVMSPEHSSEIKKV